MFSLDTPVEKLSFVGSKNLPRLKKLGIQTVKDLLWHFPHRYEDFRRQAAAEEIREAGEAVSLQGEIIKIKTTSLWRRHSVTEAFVRDHSGVVRAVWFNQPYLENSLPIETKVSLSGKTSLDRRGVYLSNPSYEKLSSHPLTHTGRLVPVYPETEGVTSKYLRFLIRPLLSSVNPPADSLPEHISEKHGFPPLFAAVQNIHFPSSPEEAAQARQRMAFEELFFFQLKSIATRRQALQLKSYPIKFETEAVKNLVNTLPFELTGDQKIAAFEILKDLGKKYPMNRLLNGDVGSGKTVVALIAAYQTARQNKQTVFMAPTEILAQQHYQTTTSLLGKSAISPTLDPRLIAREFSSGYMADLPRLVIGLLTGSEAKISHNGQEEKIGKKIMREKIAKGEIDILIGTHAVIQKDVKFKELGLVILDEQHRFGVEQRAVLLKRDEKDSDSTERQCRHGDAQSPAMPVPHLLSMTATPIPRTLALTIYGDLDISLIKEKPKNRKKIVTKVILKNQEQKAYQFLEKEVRAGRQVFVICPRIERPSPDVEPSVGPLSLPNLQSRLGTGQRQAKLQYRHWDIWAEVKAVTEEYEKLSQKVFPQLKISMLHGKMKPKEKEKIMAGFKKGFYDILVSTSVVEVGVDIPNASVMLIENAERFGLAQLHQFRGRVGRAEHQSYCLLVNSGNNRSENKRLKALENCEDGFKLAEEDLKLRGPGEFTGHKQSGLPDLAMASLTDLELIKKARLEAKLLLKEDPALSRYPLLKDQLAKFQKIRHFE